MIIIENAKRYCLYCRTNRRQKWQYAKYAGAFESVEKGVECIKEHWPGISFQYLVQDTHTGDEYVNSFNPA